MKTLDGLSEIEGHPEVQQQLARACAAADAATAELQRCLIAGQPTARARRLLAATTGEADKVMQLIQARFDEVQAARHDEWLNQLQELERSINATMAARAAAITPPIPTPPAGIISTEINRMTDFPAAHRDAISAAAAAVTSAAARHRRAAESLSAADERANAVQQRIEGKAAARQEIVERRLGGDERPDDAAELALIEADRAALEGMLADADKVAAEQRAPAQAAAQALAAARAQVREAEIAAEVGVVVDYAGELDALLLAATRRLDALAGGTGRRPAWGGSRELRESLRRLALQRGEA